MFTISPEKSEDLATRSIFPSWSFAQDTSTLFIFIFFSSKMPLPGQAPDRVPILIFWWG